MSQLSMKLGLGIGQNNHMIQLAILAQVMTQSISKGQCAKRAYDGNCDHLKEETPKCALRCSLGQWWHF